MNQLASGSLRLGRWTALCLAAAALSSGSQLPEAAEAVSGRTNALPTTLEALVADVLERNPELNFYRAEIAAAQGEGRSAGAWANPEVEASVGQKRVRSGGLSAEGVAWSVGVLQTFEWPGRVPLRKAIANHQFQLAELGLAQFKSSLAARVRTLAYSLFAAQEKAAVAREVAGRLEELRQVLVQRDPAGLTPLLERRIIEATQLTLQRKASDAALASQAAALELNELRGAPWKEPLVLAPMDLVFQPVPEEEALLGAARTNNFELQMRRVELEQQGLHVSLAKKERYPAFSLGPFYAQERAGDREEQIGMGLSLPVPLWNRNQGGVQAAEARRHQAETSLYLTQRGLERRVIEAAQAYQVRRAEMGRWRPESVQAFREAAELADRHYRLGAVPAATYIELQKQYLEAVETLLDTRRDALQAGQELQRLIGLDLDAVRTSSLGAPRHD